MTTRELINRLLDLDPGGTLEVICTRRSDWNEVEPCEVTVVSGVKKPSVGYVMRAHPTMSDAEKAATREFVHFEGN